jgi:hypothetical protein
MKHKPPPSPGLPFCDPAFAEGKQFPSRVEGNRIDKPSRCSGSGFELPGIEFAAIPSSKTPGSVGGRAAMPLGHLSRILSICANQKASSIIVHDDVLRRQPSTGQSFLKDVRSLVLTSQLPVTRRHEQIGDPTVADGILDRLVHNAHRIEMRGDSMRKPRREKTER